jgi:hypothetical protein
LDRRNRLAGLALDDKTCVPRVDYVRVRTAWVVDGLVEADPRLRE